MSDGERSESPASTSTLSIDKILTPTNGDFSDSVDGGPRLKKKRSVMFYPSPAYLAKSNQAPYSRSAAKRDSVMALGSIDHLQHMYTRQGIANRTRPPVKGAVVAIGAAGEFMCHPAKTSFADDSFELPPSPKARSYRRPPVPDFSSLIDTQVLRATMIKDLEHILRIWDLHEWLFCNNELMELKALLSSAASASDSATECDGDTLEMTTRATRSIRSYFVALPSTSIQAEENASRAKDRFRRQSSFCGMSRSTVDTAASVSSPVRKMNTLGHGTPPPLRSTSNDTNDYFTVLRRNALDLLSLLREAQASGPEVVPAHTDGLNVQRVAIKKFLYTVNVLLASTERSQEHHGVEHLAKRLSTISVRPASSSITLQDDSNSASDKDMHSCIVTFITHRLETCCNEDGKSLAVEVASSSNLDALLHDLADGYILCKVFNAAVAQSKKPWGFIQTRDIHPLRQIETGTHSTGKLGITFRRVENLRVWAAAIMLRYSIKNTSAALSKPAATNRRTVSELHPRGDTRERHQDIIEFDPVAIARAEKGWQTMLTELIEAWMQAVAAESNLWS